MARSGLYSREGETVSDADSDEAVRLKRLHRLGILDTDGDDYFRPILQSALAALPGTEIASISLVDAERQWFKAIIGLDVKQTPRDVSFCSHAIRGDGVLFVRDATRDARFASNRLVTGSPGIRFYVGVRLVHGIGALCVISRTPRDLAGIELARLQQLVGFANTQILAHGTLHHARRPRVDPGETRSARVGVSAG